MTISFDDHFSKNKIVFKFFFLRCNNIIPYKSLIADIINLALVSLLTTCYIATL